MPRASWNGQVIAQSDDTEQADGNEYFPRESLIAEHFRESAHRTVCGWKGEASYLDVMVDGEINENAAWTYPDPLPAAEKLRGRVAFWRGVVVTD